jgi:hypothetical protein
MEMNAASFRVGRERLGRDRATMAWAWLLGLGVIAVAAERLWLLQNQPLWIDESWTAMIAGQPSWPAMWREAGLEANAPLYYFVMYLWEPLGRLSNDMLRVPSLVFTAAAAAAPLLWRMPGLDRKAAITWGALLFFWKAGIPASLDARCYSLLLFVSVLQTIAYARMLERPTLASAAIWCALASTAFATHYLSLYIIAAEGLLYLAVHRLAAVRTWPAVLLFAPSFGWVALQHARLQELSGYLAWFPALNLSSGASVLSRLVLSENWPEALLFAAALAAGLVLLNRGDTPRRPLPPHLAWTLAAGLLALTVALVHGSLRPAITPRYLTPLVPIALLGLTLLAARSRRPRAASALTAGLFLFAALSPLELQAEIAGRSRYGFEPAADFLRPARPGRVVLALEVPGAKLGIHSSLQGLMAVSFKQRDIPVEVVVLEKGQDPNEVLVAHATGGRPVIMWLYNRARGQASSDHVPDISAKHPDWVCRKDGTPAMGFIGCAPRRLFEDR